jgi:hypothetical protein
MSPLKSIALCCGAVLLVSASGSAQYYYSGGGTIPLRIDSSRMVVRFDDEIGSQGQEALLVSIKRIDSATNDDYVIDGFVACALSTGQDTWTFLTPFRRSKAYIKPSLTT